MIEIPIPQNLLEFLWIGVGLQLTIAYGDKLDDQICLASWFPKDPTLAGLIKRTMMFIHHWILGLMLVVYAGYIYPPWVNELTFLGWGIFAGDIADYPLQEYIKTRAVK